MDGFLKRMGSTVMKTLLKVLAFVCSGILAVMEAAGTEGKGGK